ITTDQHRRAPKAFLSGINGGKHLLNERSATVSATLVPGRVIRALNDSCANPLCFGLNLPCFGFAPAKFGYVRPFHESTCNKPFQAYQKYSSGDPNDAHGPGVSENRFPRDDRIQP